MIKKLFVLTILAGLFLDLPVHGQTPSGDSNTNTYTSVRNKSGLPDIPGTFVLELGFNRPFNRDSLFDIGFWGARTFNVYYQYDIRLFNSKFSLHPGIGLSLERFKLRNFYTLSYDPTDEATTYVPSYATYPGVRKSMVVSNFVEIPVELRFSTRPEDPARSFRISIGGRVGYLYDSFTKILYKEQGETKIVKDKQSFNMNKVRYGAFTKIGAGNFSVFAYYNFTPMFKTDGGPSGNEMNNFTVGISLSSF